MSGPQPGARYRQRPRIRDYEAEIERLDTLSRVRALTEAESILLERYLWRVEKKTARRASYGGNKVLARAGIKRQWI